MCSSVATVYWTTSFRRYDVVFLLYRVFTFCVSCFLSPYTETLRSYILLYILTKWFFRSGVFLFLFIVQSSQIDLYNRHTVIANLRCIVAAESANPLSESSQSFQLIRHNAPNRKIRIYRAGWRAYNECTWIMRAPAIIRLSCNIAAFAQHVSERIKNSGMRTANSLLHLTATFAIFQSNKWTEHFEKKAMYESRLLSDKVVSRNFQYWRQKGQRFWKSKNHRFEMSDEDK